MKVNEIYHGDCLELMKGIPAKSIDMILCDLPYGTTACKWDVIIPFAPLWEQYERIIKDNGAIVLTASQPFTSALVMSNPKLFKYEWIWNKEAGSNFANAKKMPLKYHENVTVFYKALPTYNPQLECANKKATQNKGKILNGALNCTSKLDKPLYIDNGLRQPKSILTFGSQLGECNNINRVHPTQKPVELFEYLIKTYTNEGETVLDNCAGSHTTAIAAIRTNRKYICIEKELKYHLIGKERIEKELSTPKQNQQFAA